MIISDPAIMMGKPTVKGTRITVEIILEKMAAGEAIPELLAAYPALKETDIQDALNFAAAALKADAIFPSNKAS